MKKNLQIPATTIIPLDDFCEMIRSIVEEAIIKAKKEEIIERPLSPKEASELLQVSKATLRTWTNEGLIKVYKIGGKVYYKQGELFESLSKRKKYKQYKSNLHAER